MTIDDKNIIHTILKNKGYYPGDPQYVRVYSYYSTMGQKKTYSVFLDARHDDLELGETEFVKNPVLLMKDGVLTDAGKAELGNESKPVDPRIERAKTLNGNMRNFTGSMLFWRHPIGNLLLTEGAKFCAETAGAWWFIDVIGSYQLETRVRRQDFQVWKLEVNLDKSSGKVSMEDGNNHVILTQSISNTDFPLSEFTLWGERNEFGGITVLLPSEH